jgi:hypothetical protein
MVALSYVVPLRDRPRDDDVEAHKLAMRETFAVRPHVHDVVGALLGGLLGDARRGAKGEGEGGGGSGGGERKEGKEGKEGREGRERRERRGT